MSVILFLLTGLVLGAAILFWIFWEKAPGMMILENESRYGFEETDSLLSRAVAEKEWKTPFVHDLQQTMRNNGFEVRKVKVFEVCKPALAHQVLKGDQERVVSSLMPCRIAIYERSDGKVYISRMNSGMLAKPMKGVVPEVMKQAAREIEEIVKPLLRD